MRANHLSRLQIFDLIDSSSYLIYDAFRRSKLDSRNVGVTFFYFDYIFLQDAERTSESTEYGNYTSFSEAVR